jgi:N-acetylneuraminic acid mutarotase
MGALDNAGNLWLFGGIGYDSAGGGGWLNDLWKYSPASGQWTWISGSETAGARSVYGTQGVAAIGNVPTGLFDGVAWMDASGNFWIFGGDGKDFSDNSGYLNDLWKYNLATGQWTWVSGTRQASAPGSYGTLGTTAVSNLPGANISATAWTDASGDLWFFGGFGPDAAGNLGLLNDLWKYSPSLGQWTWVGGGAHDNQAGVYGIEGTPASSNLPGSRGTLISWPGATGHVWIFGGYGVDSTGAQGYLNDLWEYAP